MEAGQRRHLLMTIGFGAAIAFAVLALLAAVGKYWYDDHAAAMLTVNGQSVSKDAFRQSVAVEKFRLDQQEATVRALVTDGHLTATDGDTQITSIDQKRQSVIDDTNTAIIDGIIQTGLLQKDGLSVTPADVDAAWTKDATIPEARDAYLISVAPGISTGETSASPGEIDLAKKKAQEIKAKLDSGTSWDDVAKANGTGASVDGSIGWVTANSTAADSKVIDAIFTLPENGISDIIETTDGNFAIARVKTIAPARVDAEFAKKVSDAGVDQGTYRTMLGYEVAKQKLSDKVIADATQQPTLQRQVSEIKLSAAQGTGDEVRVRHILISPNGDASKASTVPETDPAWTKAKDDAQRIYGEITAGKVTFADAAKQSSNDTGSSADGGLLPWLTKDSVVTEFGDAIFADGLTPGQVLAPIKTQYGWHIIQFEGRRPSPEVYIETLRQQAMKPGADFATLAKEYSDATDAATGGEIGWVAKLQLPADQEAFIFATPVGGVSEVLAAQDGFYIFKVTKEDTRLPDPSQASMIKGAGFDRWYAPLRADAKVVQETQPSAVMPSATP